MPGTLYFSPVKYFWVFRSFSASMVLVVPRSQEHFEGVSINALSFGGTIYVRQPEQVELIRQTGPLQALGRVGRALS